MLALISGGIRPQRRAVTVRRADSVQPLGLFALPQRRRRLGLPAWEAMCAGIPTIYTNYSAHAEFLGKANAGLAVGGILQPEPKNCIWRMIADLPEVIEAVRRLYFDRKLATLLGSNGRAFVQNYTPEVIVEKWHKIFQSLAARDAL